MIFGIIVLEQVKAVIKSVLTTYHDHIASWRLCITAHVHQVRLVILPLTIKQFRSMAVRRSSPRSSSSRTSTRARTPARTSSRCRRSSWSSTRSTA